MDSLFSCIEIPYYDFVICVITEPYKMKNQPIYPPGKACLSIVWIWLLAGLERASTHRKNKRRE